MKTKYVFTCLLSIAFYISFAQNPYDSTLAKKLGADDYGMRNYVIAFLKMGPVEIKDTTEKKKLLMAHLKNIQRLASEGKLVVAGPFTDNQPLEGIFIFNVATVEEARALTATDPAIQAGTLDMELHPWYGSAALMEIPMLHQKVQKRSFSAE